MKARKIDLFEVFLSNDKDQDLYLDSPQEIADVFNQIEV